MEKDDFEKFNEKYDVTPNWLNSLADVLVESANTNLKEEYQKQEKLIEYANKLHNMEYGSDDIENIEKELEENGIVAVIGASDDLCEMYGAIHDEFDCYNGNTLYWNGKNFFTESQKEEFLGYVDDQYPEFFEMCQKLFKNNAHYIKIEDGKNCQFEYTTNIPNVRFAVMEDDELYCAGILFFAKDLK